MVVVAVVAEVSVDEVVWWWIEPEVTKWTGGSREAGTQGRPPPDTGDAGIQGYRHTGILVMQGYG